MWFVTWQRVRSYLVEFVCFFLFASSFFCISILWCGTSTKTEIHMKDEIYVHFIKNYYGNWLINLCLSFLYFCILILPKRTFQRASILHILKRIYNFVFVLFVFFCFIRSAYICFMLYENFIRIDRCLSWSCVFDHDKNRSHDC